MTRRRIVLLLLAGLLALAPLLIVEGWRADAAPKPTPLRVPMGVPSIRRAPPIGGARPWERRAPAPAIDPYVRPTFRAQMVQLRPAILAAARRHNHPEISSMSDHEFAVVIATLLYNENFGWLEDEIPTLQALTPLYEGLQIETNDVSGTNLSVRPANLRPSVALEILRHEVPVPGPAGVITREVEVAGSQIQLDAYTSQSELYMAINQEIAQPAMAVEYLTANLERGFYRAEYEGVRVTWRTLAAWHNAGVVSPDDIRDDAWVRHYLQRASAYLGPARALLAPPACSPSRSHRRCHLAE